MRVLKSLAILIILLSPAANAGVTSSLGTCQKMVLSLLDSSDENTSQSKQQFITLINQCMKKSEYSEHPESFKTLQLMNNERKTITTQARI
jgi:glutamine amidotransferase PdxT